MTKQFNFAHLLYNSFEHYKEKRLNSRRVIHSDIIPIISDLKNKNNFTITKAGSSYERRDIYLISAGTGKNKIFLWSQMHGDESTATMAIFDIINWLLMEGFEKDKETILSNNTIYFLPLVNPDGAEKYTRRTSLNIDLNRDAFSAQSIESKILIEVFNKINPDFGFNLHDQDRFYSPGKNPGTAAISFLAPPFDEKNTVNKIRKIAMQVISGLFIMLNEFIPGHIGKYDDEFEPRAFGDNFQKWGMSTILVESGYWKDDFNKQFIRKLNFILLLHAFKCIAKETYKNCTEEIYNTIPVNDERLFDLLIKNVYLNGTDTKVDIGINRDELLSKDGSIYYESKIEDIGDLSTFNGIEEYDFSEYSVKPANILKNKFDKKSELKKIKPAELYKTGVTSVKLNSDTNIDYSPFPFNIIRNKSFKPEIKIDSSADLTIEKNGKIKYLIINGFLYNLELYKGKIYNGKVIK